VTRAGAHPDGASCDGRTALHIAVSKGNAESIQWLVETEKANVNAINFAGETPLYHALFGAGDLVVLFLVG
jgi:ankyrin repeat protein